MSGGIRPDERALKRHDRRFSGFTVLTAAIENLTVNVRNFTVLADVSRQYKTRQSLNESEKQSNRVCGLFITRTV